MKKNFMLFQIVNKLKGDNMKQIKIFTLDKFETKLKKLFAKRNNKDINYLMSEFKTRDNIEITKDNFKEYGFMTPDNILMFFCDDYDIFLNIYLDFEVMPSKKPTLEYNTTIKKEEMQVPEFILNSFCKYSSERLIKIIDVLNVTYESVELQIKNEYPITLTTTNKDTNLTMGFILAPRIDYDD